MRLEESYGMDWSRVNIVYSLPGERISTPVTAQSWKRPEGVKSFVGIFASMAILRVPYPYHGSDCNTMLSFWEQ